MAWLREASCATCSTTSVDAAEEIGCLRAECVADSDSTDDRRLPRTGPPVPRARRETGRAIRLHQNLLFSPEALEGRCALTRHYAGSADDFRAGRLRLQRAIARPTSAALELAWPKDEASARRTGPSCTLIERQGDRSPGVVAAPGTGMKRTRRACAEEARLPRSTPRAYAALARSGRAERGSDRSALKRADEAGGPGLALAWRELAARSRRSAARLLARHQRKAPKAGARPAPRGGRVRSLCETEPTRLPDGRTSPERAPARMVGRCTSAIPGHESALAAQAGARRWRDRRCTRPTPIDGAARAGRWAKRCVAEESANPASRRCASARWPVREGSDPCDAFARALAPRPCSTS